MNILVVKLSAIGDVIHTLPALNAIRKQYPGAHITWLVEEAAADLIQAHAALNRVLISKRKEWVKGLWGLHWHKNVSAIQQFVRTLRDTEYDIIIDFQGLFKSGILVGLARGKRKVGFDKGMNHMECSYLFYNEKVKPVDMDIHALTRALMLIESIGVHSRDVHYHIPVTTKDRAKTADLLDRHGIGAGTLFVAINPMAKWSSKLWGYAKFARLASQIRADLKAQVVFTGSAKDRLEIAEIESHMGGGVVNLAGKTTLKMLAALYQKAGCVITADTGPMHLAAAVEAPLVAIFGPTAPWRTGPFGEGHRVLREGLDCSPCFKRNCRGMECMKQISVAAVYANVEQVLQLPKKQDKGGLNGSQSGIT